MGDLFLNNPDLQRILDTAVPLLAFIAKLSDQSIPDWQRRLTDDPSCLETIESEVLNFFQNGAGMIVCGLIAKTLKEPSFDQRAEKVRQQYACPLTKGRPRMMSLSLACGFDFKVSTQYCEPVRRTSDNDEKSAHVSGLDIEMSQFGFMKSESPYFQSRVARAVTLAPSIDIAQQELERQGISLDPKAVRRIGIDCGISLLNLRERELQGFVKGNLKATSELKGKRVSVQMDGGRTRIRSGIIGFNIPILDIQGAGIDDLDKDTPGRSKRAKKVRRQIFYNWREPKLIRIFVHDDEGNLDKESGCTIDGTFDGPDRVALIVAMHLHRMGIAEAKSLSFVCDGATWIWERIPEIIAKAKVPKTVMIEQVLDCCHAVHHVYVAIKSLGMDSRFTRRQYRRLRTKLRNGNWQQVVARLEDFANKLPTPLAGNAKSDFNRELNYLRTHGNANRLDYSRFKLSGVPMGSGAIESSIRRVVNQRLKSNGTHWRAENAEAMLQLRSVLISNRWDERIAAARVSKRQNGTEDFKLAFKERAKKLEAATSVAE